MVPLDLSGQIFGSLFKIAQLFQLYLYIQIDLNVGVDFVPFLLYLLPIGGFLNTQYFIEFKDISLIFLLHFSDSPIALVSYYFGEFLLTLLNIGLVCLLITEKFNLPIIFPLDFYGYIKLS